MDPNTGVASYEQVGSLSRAPKALATSDSETKSGSKGEENLPHLQLPRRVRSTSRRTFGNPFPLRDLRRKLSHGDVVKKLVDV